MLRTPATTAHVREQAAQLRDVGRAEDAKDLLQQHSLQPNEGYLATLTGANTHMQVAVDMLHLMFSHGLVEWFLFFAHAHLEGKDELRSECSDMLKKMPKFPNVKIFTTQDLWKLSDLNLGSAEYEALLLQLPYVFANVVGCADLVPPALALARWYSLAIKKVNKNKLKKQSFQINKERSMYCGDRNFFCSFQNSSVNSEPGAHGAVAFRAGPPAHCAGADLGNV